MPPGWQPGGPFDSEGVGVGELQNSPSQGPLHLALPSGALSVGAGLLISGASAYAFLAVASRTLTPPRYASLATLWSLTFLVWPGSFVAIEREAARRLAPGDLGDAEARVARRPMTDIYRFAVLLVLGGLLLIALGHSVLAHLLNHDNWLTLDLAIAGPAIGLQYLAFGVFAGNRRFGGYSLVGAAEGLSRLAFAGLLVLFDVHAAGPFGFTLAVAPLIAVLATASMLRQCTWSSFATSVRGMSTMAWSLGSNLCLALLVNSGPVLVRLLAPHQPAVLTGRFLSALVIVRIPLFLYAAASATLMPALSASAEHHQWRAFRGVLNRLVAIVIVLGAGAVPLAALFGPDLMRVLFGRTYVLDGLSLALLAATTMLLILGSTLSVALTATGAVKYMFSAWILGIAVLGACCLIPLEVVRRVELALLLGSALAAFIMGIGLLGRAEPRASRRTVPTAGA